MTVRPIWRRSLSSIVSSTCYIGCVVPTFVRRSGPRNAVSPGNSTSVGRPAEYKTSGEYAGRVPTGLTRDKPTRLRAGSRRHGGRTLRAILMGAMALALAGCAKVEGGDDNTIELGTIAPPIADMLEVGDIAACTHPDVIAVFQENSRVTFAEARAKLSITRDQYDAVEPVEIEFKETSASAVNKDIAEVKCTANIYAMGRNTGFVEYAVRPDASGRGFVIVYDDKIGGIIALAKLDHMNELERAIPNPALPSPSPSNQGSGADTGGAAEPQPAISGTDFEKAQAALADDPSSSASTGN